MRFFDKLILSAKIEATKRPEARLFLEFTLELLKIFAIHCNAGVVTG